MAIAATLKYKPFFCLIFLLLAVCSRDALAPVLLQCHR